MQAMDELRYSEGHLWIRRQGEELVLGVTEFAVEELGEIVFVELPGSGRHLEKGEPICSLESVKTVTELYCPLSGTITRVNGSLAEAPEKLPQSPYEDGWLCALKPDDPGQWEELLTEERYRELYGSD